MASPRYRPRRYRGFPHLAPHREVIPIPHHTLAWSTDLVTATLTELTPLADGIFAIVNGRFMPPSDVQMMAGVGYGTNLQRILITTPKLRQISPVNIRPIQGTLIGANDANHFLLDRNPLRLRGQEEIVPQAIQNAGANQRITLVACLADRLIAAPPGDVYTIRATSVTAAVANAWTQIVYTFDNVLPAGRYAVVLCEHQSANGQAVRLTFDQQYFRAGAPSINAVLSRLPYQWYEYFMGTWGYFQTFTQPRVEVLCNAADAAHELYFHVVPLAA